MKKRDLFWLDSPHRWRDSATISFAIVAAIETIFAISDISLDCIWGSWSWIWRLFVIAMLFGCLAVLCFIIKYFHSLKGIALNINGMNINIIHSDLFKCKGWKVIACNEYYDTQVDDVVIAHNTIHGHFIDEYVHDINALQNIIITAAESTNYKIIRKGDKYKFALGSIIPYDGEYMLLSFTHFENNQAFLSQHDYEECLRKMWQEISRTYANKQPIFIPLLGSGITRFDVASISDFQLLKCMLCTLKNCNIKINQPINIVLTKEKLESINIYELKNFK